MSATTFPDFGAKTEASTVVEAFATCIRGRTIVITGVNKLGIGYATAQALASESPSHLIITGRSKAKLQECLDGLRQEHPSVDIRPLIMDLSSQKSVRKAATELLSWDDVPTVDVLINNAGVMSIPERTLSEDGIELHLATNHVGHFLFTNLIMPKLLAASASNTASTNSTRIINISSMATSVSPLRPSDPNFTQPSTALPPSERLNLSLMKMTLLDVDENMTYIPMAAYGQSKTANILFSVALNARFAGATKQHRIRSFAVHPGEVLSELQRMIDREWWDRTWEWKKKIGLEYKSLPQGAATALVAALDPKLGVAEEGGSGVFLSDCKLFSKVPEHAVNSGAAETLWGLSEGWVGEEFTW